jgi:hypothetical protein
VSNSLYAARRRRYRLLGVGAGACVVLSFLHPLFAMPLILLASRRFRYRYYRLFIHSATFPTCGTVLPLVGSWRCGGCGFVQHRHVYQPCGKCRAAIPEVPCPRCEHGVFL